jgi:hypothetical protein
MLKIHLTSIIEIMMSSSSSSSSNVELSELSLNMCWIVGERATVTLLGLSTVCDLFSALETLTYEQIFKSSSSSSSSSSSRNKTNELIRTRGELHSARLLHVLISAMTKLGARVTDLALRVQLCLSKIINNRDILHYSIRSR